MHKTRGWTGLRAAALALGLGGALATGAQASPMPAIGTTTANVDYQSIGTIGLTGIAGSNIISFDSIDDQPLTVPSFIGLGAFKVGFLGEGQSTTYTDTPFAITYYAKSVNGSPPLPNETPITITGVLNGTVFGGTQSSRSLVTATFNPIANPSFQTGDVINTLSILSNTVGLVPNKPTGTTVEAYLNVSPVPEPATVAIFLTAAVGLALRRRMFRAAA